MKENRRFLAAALIAVGAVALCSDGISAQENDAMMGGEMEMMGNASSMMRMMAFSPHHILRHGEPLQLTDEQRASLMAIQHEAMQTKAEAMETHDANIAELMAMFGGTVDAAAAQRLFSTAHAAGGEAHWAEINAAIQAMGVLTDSQRQRVMGWGDMMGMMKMMSGHGEGDEDEMMGDEDGGMRMEGMGRGGERHDDDR